MNNLIRAWGSLRGTEMQFIDSIARAEREAQAAILDGVPDLKLTGDVDLDGDGVIAGSEVGVVLLEGTILAAGYENLAGQMNDKIDLRFAPTAGLLYTGGVGSSASYPPYFGGGDIGMWIDLETSNWGTVNYNFSESFTAPNATKAHVIPFPCTLGDYVWYDLNADGIQNDGATGINGVTLNLRKASDYSILATTMTMFGGPVPNNGYYQFGGLCEGSYKVELVPPAGYVLSPPLQGGDPAAETLHCQGVPLGRNRPGA